MEEVISDIFTGIFSIGLALLGLVLAANARDPGMSVFGYGLILFGVLFVFARIGAHYDRQEAEGRHHG